MEWLLHFYCCPVMTNIANQELIKKWADIFSAMSQETRLQLLITLAGQGEDGLNPTALADDLAIPANSLSFHLRALEQAGLIKIKKNGRFKTCSVEFYLMEEAIRFLMKEFFGATDIRFRVTRRQK